MKFAVVCGSLVVAGALFVMTDAANAADQRAYGGAMPVVTVGGIVVTGLKSIEGGSLTGEAVVESRVVEQKGASFPKKHLGPLHAEPLVLEVHRERTLGGWITDTLNGNTATRSVAVSSVDFNHKETGKAEYGATRLVEVDFPALDAASREAFVPRVVLQPDLPRRSAGSGATVTSSPAVAQQVQLVSNFRVAIPGLPCTRIAKVMPLTVKASPTGLSVSNLIFSISLADLKPWQDWQDAVARMGGERAEVSLASDAQEKTGTLELLGADMSTVTARFTFKGLGLARLALDKQGTGDTIERFTVEMYVEDVKYTPIDKL
jgi:hypothetical protein